MRSSFLSKEKVETDTSNLVYRGQNSHKVWSRSTEDWSRTPTTFIRILAMDVAFAAIVDFAGGPAEPGLPCLRPPCALPPDSWNPLGSSPSPYNPLSRPS